MVPGGLAEKPVGVVLSGGSTRGFNFVVLEGSEDAVEEGKYVMVREGSSYIVAMVESLEYYHEFYQEQDVWIASVRRGRRIPEDLAARQYLRATARTVAGVPVRGGGLERVRRPPRPGSPVYLVGPDVLKLVLGWDPDRAEEAPAHLIPLGYLLGYEDKYHAYLDLRALTMHFAVMGTTGSGKSNTMGVILEELGKKAETNVGLGAKSLPGPVPALVVDVNNDYVDFYREKSIVGNYMEVIRLVLKNSEAEKYQAYSHDRAKLKRLILDLNELNGAELAEAIVTLYRKGPSESAVLQLGYLEQLFSDHDTG